MRNPSGISKVLVGFNGGRQEKTLVHRDKLCKQKGPGGLGFQDIEAFNVTILSKQGYSLLHDPNSLLAHILKPSTTLIVNRGYLVRPDGHLVLPRPTTLAAPITY